jgi:hypothetical protein
MLGNLLSSLLFVAAAAAPGTAAAPVECIYAATPAPDRQAIGGLSARGGGQRSEAESAAINRLLVNDKGCRATHKWTEPKAKAALDYARALFLRDYGKAGLTARKLPIAPAENTYAKMTPAMRSGLLSGSMDPAIKTILTGELKKAGVKPDQVGREDGQLMGNILAAMAAADNARTTFGAR